MGERLHFSWRDRGLQLWRALPLEAQRIYTGLDPAHEEELGVIRRRENRAALEVLAALCDKNHDSPAVTLIPKHSPHLRGSSLERTLHPHAIDARNEPHLKLIMSPVIGELIDAGSRHLSKYVRSGRPLSLDNFRYGVLLLKTAALFNPDVVRDVTHSLNRSLGGYSKEYPIIALLLPSVAGWGSDPNAISSGDLAYLDFWLRSPDPEMRIYRANHVLAYYAPAKRGRQLLEMMPGTARERMTETADLLRESLIDEAHRKQEEGYTNAAWVAATYLKVHAGIKYLDGCWTQLSEHQARKLQDFIVFARYKTRCFDGAERRGLHASMSSVENAIIGMQRYNLHAKTYKGP